VPDEPAPEPEPACASCRGYGFVRRAVPISDPDFGRAIPCHCRLVDVEQRRQEHYVQAGLSLLPRAASGQTFDRFRLTGFGRELATEAYETARAWAEREDDDDAVPPLLFIYGTTGNGKTHLSYAAAHRLIERGKLVVWQNLPAMLDRFRNCFDARLAWERDGGLRPPLFAEEFANVLEADYLILDDLGAQVFSEWAAEKLYLLVDDRYRQHKPLFVTCNSLFNQIPDRLASRFKASDVCRLIWNQATDCRPYVTQLQTQD